MKLAWATDVHLDFARQPALDAFCDEVRGASPDGLLLAGDIATAESVVSSLASLQRRLELPIWFVLGNHDFYGGSVAAVRRLVTTASGGGRPVWLGAVDVVPLGERTGLVGHDGWGDGRLGDPQGTTVVLNDFRHIADLAGIDHAQRLRVLNRLGEQSAAHLRHVLPLALARFEHVLVLTHVPPFRQACWHEGQVSSDDFLPYFACRATGEALLEAAAGAPGRSLTVLCGHTHSPGEYRAAPNLLVVTGGADYGRPRLQPRILEV